MRGLPSAGASIRVNSASLASHAPPAAASWTLATRLKCVRIPYNIKLYTVLHVHFFDYGVRARASTMCMNRRRIRALTVHVSRTLCIVTCGRSIVGVPTVQLNYCTVTCGRSRRTVQATYMLHRRRIRASTAHVSSTLCMPPAVRSRRRACNIHTYKSFTKRYRSRQ